MSSLREQARDDWERFLSDPNGFGTSINFLAPAPGDETADIFGLATTHHIGLDSDGVPINTKNTHVSVSEKLLIDAGYPVRDGSGEVAMLRHRVKFTDINGTENEYAIQEMFPDETVGVLTFILGDFE